MLERDIQKKVRDYAKRQGWLTFKWDGTNARGVPDCIFINPNGLVMFVEFKATGKKPTKLQTRRIDQLENQGAFVAIIDNVDTGKNIVDLFQEIQGSVSL